MESLGTLFRNNRNKSVPIHFNYDQITYPLTNYDDTSSSRDVPTLNDVFNIIFQKVIITRSTSYSSVCTCSEWIEPLTLLNNVMPLPSMIDNTLLYLISTAYSSP